MRALENSISSDGSVRRESREGRDYLVFPSVIAKEMVLDYPEFGRKEYLPAENLRQSAHAWAGAPITVDHPPDRGNGRTANTPEAYTSDVIGNLFNPEVIGRENDRIKAEAWVDIEKARSLGGEYENILNRLESGDEVGVSIGYGTIEDDLTPGEFEGESYELKQGTPVPDHLALVSSQNRPRATPEDGVGAPRLNHIDMNAEPETSDDMDIGMLRSGIRKLAEAAGIRLNQETGDAVRWDSDAGGEREPSGSRYGVVVNGLNASDEPDDSVYVAVYRANSDYDGWENTGDQQAIQTETLEVIGSNGKQSLPAISQVFDRQNAVEDEEPEESEGENDPDEGVDVESNSDSDGSEEAEGDDRSEPNTESTDSTTTDDSDDGNDAEPDDDLLETMTDNDNESDFNRDETIESLDSDEDVPFDANVLEEMTDEQILTISPDAADGDEAPDDVDDGRKEEGVDEEDASAEDADENEAEGDEDEEENPDAEAEVEAEIETETTDSPETPGDDSTETKVEMTVNELADRVNSLEEKLEETQQENEELREKVDPDVIQAKQARKQLAEATETDAEELAALPDETAINMAANLDDSAGMARANTMPGQQTQSQQRPNMAGAPGPVSRTNTEDEDLPPAGREAYDQRKNGDS